MQTSRLPISYWVISLWMHPSFLYSLWLFSCYVMIRAINNMIIVKVLSLVTQCLCVWFKLYSELFSLYDT